MSTSQKTIVITGVSRGCGRALTEEFIRLGHVVIGCGRSEKEIAALQNQFPAPNHFSVVDVADDAQVAAWARQVLARHDAPAQGLIREMRLEKSRHVPELRDALAPSPRPSPAPAGEGGAANNAPDFLLNNAALINRNAPLWEVPAREFSEVIDVNIKGTANVIRHFVPAMIRRGRGVIVNFSSGWGRSTDAKVAPYCATKWAIEGLTQSLAQELPPGMCAVPLNPGIIATDMLRSCFGGSAGSYPPPAEWAKAAAPFILKIGASDNGRPLTVS